MLEFFCRCSTCIYLLQFVKQIKRYAYGWCCVESHIGNRRWESTIYKVTVALTYQTYFLCWIRPKTLVCYGLLWPEPEETPARGYSELGWTCCALCQVVSKPMVTKYIKISRIVWWCTRVVVCDGGLDSRLRECLLHISQGCVMWKVERY